MTNKLHIKVGDKVKVISGDQKGYIGVIKTILSKKSVVFIEGILPRVKYTKNKQGGDPQKVEIQISIHISNIQLWDNKSNSAGRIGYKLVDNVKKRYFKKSGNLV